MLRRIAIWMLAAVGAAGGWLTAEPALGQVSVWTGQAGPMFPFWNNAENWDGGVVPGPADTAIFDDSAAGFIVNVAEPAVVGTIEFQNELSDYVVQTSAVSPDGPALSADLMLLPGAGNVLFESISPSPIEFGNVEVLQGTLNTGVMSNIVVRPDGQFNVFPEGTLVLGGDNSQLETPLLQNDGTLSGSGLVAGQVDNNGLVAPGPLSATLAIFGSYVQSSDGILRIDVEGSTIGEFDRLDISGDVTLDGTIEVLVAQDLLPGTTLEVISNGGATEGVFRTVDTVGDDSVFFAPAYSSVFLTLYMEGDMNLDSMYTSADIDAFVLALRNRESYFGTYFVEGDESGDIDDDNDLDFDDIDDFVDLIPGVSSAQSLPLLAGVPEPSAVVMMLIVACNLSMLRRRRLQCRLRPSGGSMGLPRSVAGS